MSINSEISRIDDAKADIKEAIEGKGVSVPSSTKIDGMAEYINQISTGGEEADMYAGRTEPADAEEGDLWVDCSDESGDTPYAIISVTYPVGSTCTCSKGGTVLIAEGTGGKYNFGVPEVGEWTLYCTDGSGESTDYVTVSEQYSVVNVQLTYAANPVLNNNEWVTISTTAAEGEAQNYWAVGDRKEIVLNGKVGDGLTFSNFTTYAYILGFNHNGATNTIDFGTFKTALTGGKDVCLVDAQYDKSTSGIYFKMFTSANTIGGWKNSMMRYSVLGSTDSANNNASTTTATSPVANTLMASLPSDLRAVMKPMTISTDNAGGSTHQSSGVTDTIDYLPLLSEYEINGTTYYSSIYEQSRQTRYAYYANGNSTQKYKHNSSYTGCWYWTRSCNNGNSVCAFSSGGTVSSSTANYSGGVTPIFRV